MTDQPTAVPVPLAIRQLIDLHNDKIQEYRRTSLTEIQQASLEIMALMGLHIADGWRLDLDTLQFIKVSTEQSTDGNS